MLKERIYRYQFLREFRKALKTNSEVNAKRKKCKFRWKDFFGDIVSNYTSLNKNKLTEIYR